MGWKTAETIYNLGIVTEVKFSYTLLGDHHKTPETLPVCFKCPFISDITNLLFLKPGFSNFFSGGETHQLKCLAFWGSLLWGLPDVSLKLTWFQIKFLAVISHTLSEIGLLNTLDVSPYTIVPLRVNSSPCECFFHFSGLCWNMVGFLNTVLKNYLIIVGGCLYLTPSLLILKTVLSMIFFGSFFFPNLVVFILL